MSGAGKSSLVLELRKRGYVAYDADDDGFSEPRQNGRWGWRADRWPSCSRGLRVNFCSSPAALRSRGSFHSTTACC
jgi:hypothetical protein